MIGLIVVRSFTFDAAHNLTRYKGKCEKLHGHTYKLVVKVSGKLNEEDMVIDFSDLKKIVEDAVLSKLDHVYLNELFSQPTTERVAMWIWEQLKERLEEFGLNLCEIELWETESSGVIYRGEST